MSVLRIQTNKVTTALGGTQLYRSGMLSTEGTFSIQYGRFVTRMKLPSNNSRGIAPLFWIRPNPPNEANALTYKFLPSTGRDNQAFLENWTNSSPAFTGRFYTLPVAYGGRITGGFHEYTIEITSDVIRMLVDDTQMVRATTRTNMKNWPYHMILEVPVGDTFYTSNVTDPILIDEAGCFTEIDYVRGYTWTGVALPAPTPTPSPGGTPTPSGAGTIGTYNYASPCLAPDVGGGFGSPVGTGWVPVLNCTFGTNADCTIRNRQDLADHNIFYYAGGGWENGEPRNHQGGNQYGQHMANTVYPPEAADHISRVNFYPHRSSVQNDPMPYDPNVQEFYIFTENSCKFEIKPMDPNAGSVHGNWPPGTLSDVGAGFFSPRHEVIVDPADLGHDIWQEWRWRLYSAPGRNMPYYWQAHWCALDTYQGGIGGSQELDILETYAYGNYFGDHGPEAIGFVMKSGPPQYQRTWSGGGESEDIHLREWMTMGLLLTTGRTWEAWVNAETGANANSWRHIASGSFSHFAPMYFWFENNWGQALIPYNYQGVYYNPPIPAVPYHDVGQFPMGLEMQYARWYQR